MPKKKPSPKKQVLRKPEQKIEREKVEQEAGSASAGLIKMLIIVGTFVAIATLSIVTQGPDDGWPSVSVVVARIVLLSACAAIYFGMLYHTRASRQNEKPKPLSAKK